MDNRSFSLNRILHLPSYITRCERQFPSVASILIVALFLAPAVPAFAQVDNTLKKLADEYWEATMESYPTRATSVGDYRFNDRLEDVSEAGRHKWQTRLQGLLSRVRKIRNDSLPESDRITHELLDRALQDDLLRLECLQHFTPLTPLDGPHIDLPLILVSQPFRNADDYRAYAKRLREFPKFMSDHITNMRKGLALGWASPRITMEKVVPQIRMHLVADPTASEFYAPIREGKNLSEADRPAVEKEVREAIASGVIPAYLQLLAFVEDEYLDRCREKVGIGSLENGRSVYDSLANLHTTVRLNADEIHNIGLSETGRLRQAMDDLRKKIGFEGNIDEFIVHMRTDPKQRFQSRDELIAAADGILKRTQPLMPKLFGRLPKAECVMKELESYRAATSPVAYYNPTPEDGSRPGFYYINTYAPQERLKFTLEALSYHEAVPGHHLQYALDQENQSIPRFRRYGYYNAYSEGWALYSEKLGYDMGGYTDLYQQFGQLTFEMWRACRLVVDTGMHAKGWSRKEAIDYMARNTPLAMIDIETEIDRYISWPGQALAYKIGELRILALRKEAEQKLGAKFDIRAFHDALLMGGAMPIDMLEKRMREWMGKQ